MTIRITLICLFLTVLQMGSFAQNKRRTTPGAHFGISYGLSFPLRDYKSIDYSIGGESTFGNGIKNEKTGFAQPGRTLKLYYSTPVYKKLGITASLANHNHPLDEIALAKQYPHVDVTTTANADDWKIWSLLLGPSTVFHYNRWHFDFYATAGMAKTILPYQEINQFYKGNPSDSYIFDEASNYTFAYKLGTSIRYGISQKLHMLLHLDYYSMPSSFSPSYSVNSRTIRYEERLSTPYPGSNKKGELFKQNIEMINISLGLTYQLSGNSKRYKPKKRRR